MGSPAEMVEVLHKHKIPMEVASEEPVNACRNELWMLSCVVNFRRDSGGICNCRAE